MRCIDSVSKVIMCLRADYDAIKAVKKRKDLLNKQGIVIINDYINSKIDVIISPLKNTPEYEIYHNNIKDLKNVIYDEDPDIALNKAVAYPNNNFNKVLIGIDPGIMCGYVIISDGIVILSGKVPCDIIGKEIKDGLSKIPYKEKEVILGSGEGWSKASVSLLNSGLPYKIVKEYSVAKFMPKTPIFNIFKDKDVRSAMAIALKGSRNWMDH